MRGPFETLVVAADRALIPTHRRRMPASSATISIFRWVVRSAMMSELFMIDLPLGGLAVTRVYEFNRFSAERLRISIRRAVGTAMSVECSSCVKVREIVSIVRPR